MIFGRTWELNDYVQLLALEKIAFPIPELTS